jgi:hypothetical protein
MEPQAQTETMFSPRRWFLGDDGRVRPLWRSLLFIVLTVVLIVLAGRAMYLVGMDWPREARFGFRFVVFVGVLLLESWFLLSVFDRRPFRNLGLWLYGGAGKEFLRGAAIGGALMGAGVLTMVVAGAVTYHGLAAERLHGFVLWGLVLLAASAAEEIAFRGYGMQRMIQAMGETPGVLIFSALFALVHMDNPGSTLLATINTFFAGVLLGLAYLKTRALWLPIGLHWAWNFSMGQIYSLPISGLNFAPRLFQAEVSGPEWLTGGSYGPEGSALMTVIILLGVIWMGQTHWISPSPAVEEGLE